MARRLARYVRKLEGMLRALLSFIKRHDLQSEWDSRVRPASARTGHRFRVAEPAPERDAVHGTVTKSDVESLKRRIATALDVIRRSGLERECTKQMRSLALEVARAKALLGPQDLSAGR
jgi:hypothetical protein